MRDHRGQPCRRTLPSAQIWRSTWRGYCGMRLCGWRGAISVVVLAVALSIAIRVLTGSERAGMVTAIVAFLVLVVVIDRIKRTACERGMVGARRCAACAYDLRATSPDPDGCTLCPECGAAWRLPPTPDPSH